MAKQTPTPAPKKLAPEVVYLYRVQGDDPTPYSVSLRADGTAQRDPWRRPRRLHEARGRARLGRRRALDALAEHAPFKRLDGMTVKPGGFGGWDNDIRYMIRRGKQSITVTADRMPRSIRPLVHNLDAIIDGDTGREDLIELPRRRSATSTTSLVAMTSGHQASPSTARATSPPSRPIDRSDTSTTPPTDLVTHDLVEGDGAEIARGDTADVQYVGVSWSTGHEFDASWDRGAQPFSFPVGAGRVIARLGPGRPGACARAAAGCS